MAITVARLTLDVRVPVSTARFTINNNEFLILVDYYQ